MNSITSSTLYKNGRCLADCISNAEPRDEQPEDWAVHGTRTVWRRLAQPTKINGRVRSRYQCVEVTSYVNLRTGEVIPATDGEAHGLIVVGAVGRKAIAREQAVRSLRPEVRDFARFCLAFRNKRRGVTPGFDKLAVWYAALHGKRPDNVRRYFAPLEKAGIKAGESVLGVDWQISGIRAGAHAHLKEDQQAEATYARMCRDRAMPITAFALRLMVDMGARPASKPEWLEVVRAIQEVAARFGGAPLPAESAPTKLDRTNADAFIRAVEFLSDPSAYLRTREASIQ